MSTYIALFENEDGSTEHFGPFDSRSAADAWVREQLAEYGSGPLWDLYRGPRRVRPPVELADYVDEVLG